MGSNLSVLPLANASGSVVVSLLVSDGLTDAVQVNVTVVVKPINDAPRLNQTELLVVLAEDSAGNLIRRFMKIYLSIYPYMYMICCPSPY